MSVTDPHVGERPASVSPETLAGMRFGPSAWRQVDQDSIDAFAAITRDRQWIHVDVERARRESPFGTTIAHGTLLLAMIDGFRDEIFEAIETPLAFAAGWDRVRFLTPVVSGAYVRASIEIGEIAPAGDGWRITECWTLELKGSERPACVAEAVGRVL